MYFGIIISIITCLFQLRSFFFFNFFELKHSQRGERKRKHQSAFQEASSCVHSDISSIKVQFNFDNGHVLSFFPRKVSPDENASLEDEGVKKSQDLAVI